ncbi:MAG: dihydrofolate reductase family protein, partial [Flavitalea sp.]
KPSPTGIAYDPVVAKGMNESEKIVFSGTLETVAWENSRLIKDNIAKEIKKLKQLPGKDMAIMGSGTIVTQLAEQGLIDEFQLMIDPVALGEGTPIFSKIKKKLDLTLLSVRTFKSGTILCCYAPAK